MRGCGATVGACQGSRFRTADTQAACAAMSPEAVAKRAYLARQVEELQGQVEQLQGR